MRIFGKPAGGRTPSISREKITEALRQISFYPLNTEHVWATPFFQKFRDMYNGIPVCCCYTAANREKLKQCFEWMEFEITKNGQVLEGFSYENFRDPMEFQFNQYSINTILFALLTNPSLAAISTVEGETGFAELDSYFGEAAGFESLSFTEISPFTLDGELAEVLMQGSVYHRWKEDAIATKAMSAEFVNRLMEGRFSDFKVYRTTDSWNGYPTGFFIAWFIFDQQKGEFWILSKDDFT